MVVSRQNVADVVTKTDCAIDDMKKLATMYPIPTPHNLKEAMKYALHSRAMLFELWCDTRIDGD
jgi:uncharacterized protein Yka (UPF0111/DUF47 family)